MSSEGSQQVPQHLELTMTLLLLLLVDKDGFWKIAFILRCHLLNAFGWQ
jgi:hypothetical protein